ncbi:hypothetical protein [Epilithonimonas hominis]|nr:hypothetical protein [Epilithonimonas hominis]ROI11838.1 hypothetical protein EGH73_12925 [Epilithonimonas hominis]
MAKINAVAIKREKDSLAAIAKLQEEKLEKEKAEKEDKGKNEEKLLKEQKPNVSKQTETIVEKTAEQPTQ